jgi:hypothetical protein
LNICWFEFLSSKCQSIRKNLEALLLHRMFPYQSYYRAHFTYSLGIRLFKIQYHSFICTMSIVPLFNSFIFCRSQRQVGNKPYIFFYWEVSYFLQKIHFHTPILDKHGCLWKICIVQYAEDWEVIWHIFDITTESTKIWYWTK